MGIWLRTSEVPGKEHIIKINTTFDLLLSGQLCLDMKYFPEVRISAHTHESISTLRY